jgi:hypothetical protein
MGESPQSCTDEDLYTGYEPGVRINPQLPQDYFLVSTAARRLGAGMWGSLRRPDVVRQFLGSPGAEVLGFRRSSLGFAKRQEDTAEYLRNAALEGKLPIYVVGPPDGLLERPSPPTEPLRVPFDVLKRLIVSRRGFADHAIRPTLKACGGDPVWLARLCRGTLAVRASEFDRWYRAERSRRKWSSQRGAPRKSGRPSKRTEALDNAILARVNDGRWTAKEPLSKLQRSLADQFGALSVDTLGRIVDQMHAEIGDPRLARRSRRARTRKNTPTTAK